jgi:hypothetical protein
MQPFPNTLPAQNTPPLQAQVACCTSAQCRLSMLRSGNLSHFQQSELEYSHDVLPFRL